MAGAPNITAFFDEATNSVSYLVADPATGKAATIDPVLDFDAASGAVETRSVENLLAAAAVRGLTIAWSLETHAHAQLAFESPARRRSIAAQTSQIRRNP